MLKENMLRLLIHSSWLLSRCCVKNAISKIASCFNNSSKSYFVDSSYAYWMLVSYNIILHCDNAKIQFLNRTITSRSARGTGSLKFCVNPPVPSTSVFIVGEIQMKPLFPSMTDAPHVKLWKCVLRRFISDGNTLTKIPCDNLPYFKLRVCSDKLPSTNTFCTSAEMRSPSCKYFRIICSSSAERRRNSPVN